MAELSRGKKALFVAVLVLVTYVLAELASLAVHGIVRKKMFSYAEYGAERAAVLASAQVTPREFGAIPMGNPPGTIYEVLHPYLGYVQDPTRTPNYSDLGFPDADVRIYPKDPKRFVIGIFGGSFADGLSRTTKDVFRDKLGSLPRFAGREIKVLTVSMGGYKQPQQVIALGYLLSLGAHFDAVVNVDGMNEIVLPAVENVPKGVFPFYPRNWFARLGTFDVTTFALSRRQADLRDVRQRWAAGFSGFPLGWSVAANIVWKARDQTLERKMQEVNLAALEYRPTGGPEHYSTRGPAFKYAGEDEMYADLARVWKNGSIQLHHLASANGMRYLHFLQPNQYLAGTKPMSDPERAVAYFEGHPFQKSIVQGYPWLLEAGEELRHQGVAFFDLTRILADHPEPLYVDTCCHLGKPGYDIVAGRIAEEIAKLP